MALRVQDISHMCKNKTEHRPHDNILSTSQDLIGGVSSYFTALK